MSDIKIRGSEPSRFTQKAIVYEATCPKCGEPILIKADVQATTIEVSVGFRRSVDLTKSPIGSTLKPRQVA